MEQRKPYKKGMEYSYTLGAFPTIELLKCRPQDAQEVYVHSTFPERETIEQLCKPYGIPVLVNDKLIAKLSDKENCYVIGIVKKFTCQLSADKSHIVLVNPSNMGNLGTIIRTAVGLGIKNIAIISPGVDVFHPKALRASMGALFRVQLAYYDSFEAYRAEFPEHEVFCFMLNAKRQLTVSNCPKPALFSLVFGNEATGLPDEYKEKGTSIIIPQTEDVDSLNLTIAVGIGTYLFMQNGQGDACSTEDV